jgi:hypothetical protein
MSRDPADDGEDGDGTMKAKAIRTIGTTVVERAIGQQPGRWRAMSAAVFAGAATAAATYHLLRNVDDDGEDD